MRTIIAAIAIIFAGTIFFVYTKPTYDSTQAVQTQINQYNAALDKATQLQTLKQTLLSRYNSFDPGDLARLQTMLPDQVNNIGLILDLDTLANQYGLSLENVGIDSTGQSAPSASGNTAAVGSSVASYESLNVTFTIHCTYSQFIQYVTSLETSLRVVDLIGLTVTGGGAGGAASVSSPTQNSASSTATDNNVYAFGVTLRTYWLK